jgi:glycosyltransferase involved in cell wall biosynthesis
MKPAIYFHPEGYSIDTDKLMGRHAAGASFLEGFLKYSRTETELFVRVEEDTHFAEFENQAIAFGREESVISISRNTVGRQYKAGGLYLPGPGLAAKAEERALYKDTAWNLCGITHTTSSMTAMDNICSLLTAPVQSWDALICTSNAVKKNVETILQAQVDYLKSRLGITKLVIPNLPVIPLGIHTQNFLFSPLEKSKSRKELEISPEELVVLYVGRLSFHAKAHPLAMYEAVERASSNSGKKIVLIECGWFANNYIKDAFTQGSEFGCPSVRTIALDGRSEKDRTLAWSSADIFCSLSDNIQETFGIVPIEAMAAGLPVVVTDWDGYKDTVRDGIDGFRIPTIAPQPGLAGDLARRHALGLDTYDMYCGYSSSLTGVQPEILTDAFVQLFKSKELRLQMGESGRQRATQYYDWKIIIARYEELWDEQTRSRLAAQKSLTNKSDPSAANGQPPWPARLDPTIGFANYPTKQLSMS